MGYLALVFQIFQEDEVRHRQIMGIIDDQALDAILQQQFEQQVFAFAPSSPRSQPQRRQQKVPQGSFFGIIFWGRHRQHRVEPSTHPTNFARCLGAQIADAHGLAAAWLCDNDMPSPQLPRLAQEPLETLLEGGLDKTLEERQRRSLHESFSLSYGRMGRICTGYSLSGSGLASGSRKLEGVGGVILVSASSTCGGWSSSRWRSSGRPYSRSRVTPLRCLLARASSSCIRARTSCEADAAALAFWESAWRWAVASHSLTRLPMRAGQ